MCPNSVEASEDKTKKIGNSRTDPDIKFTLVLSGNKSKQIDPRGSFFRYVAHVYNEFVHISVPGRLQFEGCNANNPVSDGNGHAMRLLECISGVHREMLSHELDQLRVSMKHLDLRHRQNKVLERCRFPVNHGVGGGDIHDRYRNGLFAIGSNIHFISVCRM